MKKTLRKLAFALAAALVFCICVPVFAAEPADYNSHDVEKLRAFFSVTGSSPYSNGRAINGEGFDIDDPGTWTACTWTDDGRLYSLHFENLGWEVVGEMDLSGCTELASVIATDCQIASTELSGCTALRTLDLTGNRLTSISTAGNPNLELLWFRQNSIASVDISSNTHLRSLDCSYNGMRALDVSRCPELTVLRASNNSLLTLDISRNPRITELNVKTNLLSRLNVSHLNGLTRLISFGNRFKTLDISVLNGGEPFVLTAVGGGYVGTKVYTNSSGGPVIHASSNPVEGESFLGWYIGDELISTSEHIACPFGEAGGLQAHFTGEDPLQMGDVDANGIVNSADALQLLRYSLNIVGAELIHLEVADMNGDSFANSGDALMILRIAMGLS